MLRSSGTRFFGVSGSTTTGNPWEYWSAERIAQVAQCPVTSVQLVWPLVHRDLAKKGVATKNNQAAAIGTIAIETASTFMPVREAFWLTEEWRKANLRYYPWYGRSLIQLTWESNYDKCQKSTGYPVHDNPENAMEPEYAAGIFVWYWTVERPTIPMEADRKNWPEVRRLVQGGSDGLPRLTAICTTLLA